MGATTDRNIGTDGQINKRFFLEIANANYQFIRMIRGLYAFK
jgi:hypothetical protein